jgi:mannose-6-phosphate isomerase-like protein (cupin superfamily)
MGIEGVITEIGGLAHSDDRRDLHELFNGLKIEGGTFSAQQIKLARVKNRDVTLGGHYHNYHEFFAMLEGNAKFILEDIETKERREVEVSESSGGLLIPSLVAHKVEIGPGSVLLGATEEPYVNAEHNDKPYKLD